MNLSQFIEYAGRVLVELEETPIERCDEDIEWIVRYEFPHMPKVWIVQEMTEMRVTFESNRKRIPVALSGLASGDYQPAMDIFHHHLCISSCVAMSKRMKGNYALPDQLRALRAGLIWKKLHALPA